MAPKNSPRDDQAEVDPQAFLRHLLAISPEDAAKAREDAARAAGPDARSEAPRSDES